MSNILKEDLFEKYIILINKNNNNNLPPKKANRFINYNLFLFLLFFSTSLILNYTKNISYFYIPLSDLFIFISAFISGNFLGKFFIPRKNELKKEENNKNLLEDIEKLKNYFLTLDGLDYLLNYNIRYLSFYEYNIYEKLVQESFSTHKKNFKNTNINSLEILND